MVLLQSVLTFVFLERHWETVTRRLSTATVQNIAMLIDIYNSYPQDKNYQTLDQARQRRPRTQSQDRAQRRAAANALAALLRSARPYAVRRDQAADRQAVLDRHRRHLQPRRHTHQARQRRDACAGAAQPDLCLQFADLPLVDARYLARAAHLRHPVSAQPDQADPAPGRSRRQSGQRPAHRLPISGRAARARCARRRRPSSRCATASSAMSSSAPPCSPA